MALLGTVLLVFIATHMQNFWFKMKFGTVATVEGTDLLDLHTVVMKFFHPVENEYSLYMVIFYVISMATMGFHLQHGFSSALQSLGVNHPKYTPLIKKLGTGFCILVPLAFAAIPVFLYYIQTSH